MVNKSTLLPPPGLSDSGVWGTTTYVGPKTWAFAIAAIPTVFSPFIILLFCPLDQTDVYKLDDKLYTPDGKSYKAASSHNFAIAKSEHVTTGTPPGCSTCGSWGTTQHVGSLTWSAALVALPTIIGTILILLFMPLDKDDVYKDDNFLYLADGTKYKAASDKNFDIRRSAHVDGTPEGLAKGGTWGTMTYVGPLTWSLALGALPTVIGSIIILLFMPLDQEEVYKLEGKLYLPSGELYKAATESNFMIRNSEHVDGNAPNGLSEGEWGTTTYVGPLTFSLALISIMSILGCFIVLLLLPLDSDEVYKMSGALYLPDGASYKAATASNFYKKNAKHIQEGDGTVRSGGADVEEGKE